MVSFLINFAKFKHRHIEYFIFQHIYILEVIILCVFHARTNGVVTEKYIYSTKFHLGLVRLAWNRNHSAWRKLIQIRHVILAGFVPGHGSPETEQKLKGNIINIARIKYKINLGRQQGSRQFGPLLKTLSTNPNIGERKQC